AALDVVARVAPVVLLREAHDDRLPDVDRPVPPPGTDQLVIGSGQRRRHVRGHERPARQVAEPLRDRRPAGRIIPPDAPPRHRRPGQLPAARHRLRIDRAPHGHVPVPDKTLHIHPPILGPVPPPVTWFSTRSRPRGHPLLLIGRGARYEPVPPSGRLAGLAVWPSG